MRKLGHDDPEMERQVIGLRPLTSKTNEKRSEGETPRTVNHPLIIIDDTSFRFARA
jgi:hypothetical protein